MTELIALCAPWLISILLLVTIGFAVFKKWKWTIGLLLLAILGNWYFECLPINLPWYDNDSIQTLRVLSFNCNLSPKHKSNYYNSASKVAKLINSIDADVVFLTENFGIQYDTIWRYVQNKYQYRLAWKRLKNSTGNTLYSRYPIIADSTFQSNTYPYTITYSKINIKGISINIFSCHLSSNNYNEHHEYMTPDSVDNSKDSKAYLRNVMNASRYREDEALELVNMLSESNYPCIVMGDMNDVAGSPAMRVFAKAHLKDAWWEKGFGYGATIHKPLPYRIDHIMYRDAVVSKGSNQFQKVSGGLRLKSIRKIDSNDLSDHNALVAEFSMIK